MLNRQPKKRNIEEIIDETTVDKPHDDASSVPPITTNSEKDQTKSLLWQDRESLERFRIDNLMQLKQDQKRNEEKRKQIELLEKLDDEKNKILLSKKVSREIETSQQKENIVKLNLRGKIFITTMQTLTRRENMVKVMLGSQIGMDRDENGYITIDRDPDLFPIILEHLRTGSTTHIGIWEEVNDSSIEMLTKLLEESDYFGTEKLTAKVKELIKKYTEELKILKNREDSPTVSSPLEEIEFEVNVDDESWFSKFAMLTLEEKARAENYIAEQTKKVQDDFEELDQKEKSLPSSKDITINVRGVNFTISTAKLVQHVDSLFFEFSKKAIHTNGEFTIFLDRDPTMFTIIYEYLINGSLQNIPKEIEKRKQVFKEAKFFKLQGLIEYFDICRYPIEDIGEKNLQLKREEDFLRNLFVVDRENPILSDPYIHLINVFEEAAKFTEKQEPPEKLKLLFDFEDPMEVSSLCENSKLEVPPVPRLCSSRDQFLKQFHIFTSGIFQNLDWSNIFVAGGSVLASSLECSFDRKDELERFHTESELYFRHKMTEQYLENDDASSEDDTSTIKSSETNSDDEYFSDDNTSDCTIEYPDDIDKKEIPENYRIKQYYNEKLWGKSDVDLFLYGLSEMEAQSKIEHLYNTIKKNIQQHAKTDTSSDILILRTQHAITFRFNEKIKPVQIILRIYKSPAEILCGFDIPCCCIGFDGTQVFCIPRAMEAIKTRCNIVDPARQSTTYETRLVKYSLRGFRIGVCGYDPKKIVNPFLQDTYYFDPNIKQFSGLARILIILDSYKKRSKMKVFSRIGGKLTLTQTEEELSKPSSKHDYAQVSFHNNERATHSYLCLNNRVDYITKNLKKKPFFEYALNDISKILHPHEMKSDLSPVLEFIQIEPTRQYVGSFSPIDKNFLEDAYTFVRNEPKFKYKYVIRSGYRIRRRGKKYTFNTTLDSKTCKLLEATRRKCKETRKAQEVIIGDQIKVSFKVQYGVVSTRAKVLDNEDNDIRIDREKDENCVKYYPKKPRRSKIIEDRDEVMDEVIETIEPIKIEDPWFNRRFKQKTKISNEEDSSDSSSSSLESD